MPAATRGKRSRCPDSAGYGAGTLTLEPERAWLIESGFELTMAAVGLAGPSGCAAAPLPMAGRG